LNKASAAALAAAAAALACSCLTKKTAFSNIFVGSGTPGAAIFKLERVPESVIGFECQMKARPLPVGDCPIFASLGASCVHLMSGLISFRITGLQVK